MPFPDPLPQSAFVQGQIHRDRLAGRGEEPLREELRQPVAEQGVHAKERGTRSHLAEGLAQSMHRLPGEPWGPPGRVAQQQARIPIGRHDVVHLFARHGFRPEALTTAQQIRNEQLLVPGSGQERHRLRSVPLPVQSHVLGEVVEIVAQPAQGVGPSRIVDLQMHDVHQGLSAQTVGNTSGSLKSGSPLGSRRHSVSSNMWISRPSRLR